jgi:predicted deacetylase
MPVHVSIHDVSPAWRSEVEDALAATRQRGIRAALLVVPNFHARWPLESDPAFCERLRELQAEGHEIFLHGFFHQATERPRDGSRLAWAFRQRVVSAGEAELAAVTRSEAAERLDRGRDVLDRAGLQPTGFIAPAWSMPSWLVPMLRERGYSFSEDHTHVYDVAGGRRRASVVLNWASRSPTRLASTVLWCRLAKHARAVLPARIAIHPGDMRILLLRREIEALLTWAQGDVVARGRELFDP